jgi:hypothetical protein
MPLTDCQQSGDMAAGLAVGGRVLVVFGGALLIQSHFAIDQTVAMPTPCK